MTEHRRSDYRQSDNPAWRDRQTIRIVAEWHPPRRISHRLKVTEWQRTDIQKTDDQITDNQTIPLSGTGKQSE